MAIKVRALKTGYFGVRRFREGEVFEIPDEAAFSKNWMQKVDKRGASRAKAEEAEEADDTSKSTGDTEVI